MRQHFWCTLPKILLDSRASCGDSVPLMKVGIVGASGYSGEVLVKLLLGHPRVTLAAVTSRTHAGKPLATSFRPCAASIGG